ncbi:hypothetical protein ACFPYI_04350 [Halomarina salina]|uniref:Proteinase inhibitor I42 chagasin domain-containing protein n=1 Tax=Halomarina salina TaxID=1872699 RepID=A0ABD5RJR5_9EURY|nr:hypothetical protein [Halomarina salina]
MNRRRFLGATGGLLTALAGCTALGGDGPQGHPMSAGYEDNPIVYSNGTLQLTGPDQPVRAGDHVEFTLRNVGDETIESGCGSSWTIQRNDGESWRELIYTTARGGAGCAAPLAPGESRTTRLTLDKAGIEDSIGGTLVEEFTSGQYRFVWLGTDPFLAVRFRIDASQ